MRFKLLLILFIISKSCIGQLVINEFLASNKDNITDELNEYNDWVEVYNFSDSAIDMGGMFFSDNLVDKVLYQIPRSDPEKTTIPSKGFLVYWFDKDIDQGCMHVNLRLNSKGEQIGLYTSDGKTLLDKVNFPKQRKDISYGRYSKDRWGYFKKPTPNKSNITKVYKEIIRLDPVFSIEGGFYNTPTRVSINTNIKEGDIYYTTDGSEPNSNSNLFLEDIIIDSTVIIRAKVLKKNFIESNTVTQTYFINESFDSRGLPVFSISGHPDFFLDADSGIYVQNFKPNWEYPINIEFFEKDGRLAFNNKATIKVIGDNSWKLPQKMLSINLNKNINYPLFKDFARRNYKSFNLRCSGSDWASSLFRDGLGQGLSEDDMDIDIQGFRPSIVFINGLYMGIHNIRQKINNDYIEEEYNVNSKYLDIVENKYNTDEMEVLEGDDYSYKELFYKFENSDFSKDSEYQEIIKLIDINNFIDYIIIEIYVANHSWGHNIALWKPKNNRNNKWRWFLLDLDRGFQYHKVDRNYIEFVSGSKTIRGDNPYWTTIFLKRLFENDQFRYLFSSKLSNYLYITLHSNNVKKHIQHLKSQIENEIPNHVNRWKDSKSSYGNGIASIEFWMSEIEEMFSFAEKRDEYVMQHLIEKLELKEAVNLSITATPEKAGKVSVNDLIAPEEKWSGLYLQDIPIRFTAIANKGYKFLYWRGSSLKDSTKNMFTSTLNEDMFLEAHFAKDYSGENEIVINEINFSNSSICNTGDWIELYNPNEYPIDISNWKLDNEDINDRFSFPSNTIIKEKGFIVVCNDILSFQSLYPAVNAIGNTSFGLEKNQDVIKLFDHLGGLIDIVTYKVDYRIPNRSPKDRGNYTLELISLESDNSKSENWDKGHDVCGTPGNINSLVSIYLNEIPHQQINPGQGFEDIYLNNYITCPLSEIFPIKWKVLNNKNINVSIDNNSGIASVSYNTEWQGSEKVVFIATNKSGSFLSDSVRFSVGTVVSESVDLDCHFTKDKSPYIIRNSITIPKDSILKIESGVKVYFNDRVSISIQGKLMLEGTAEDPIYLTSHNNFWGGILLDSTSQQSIINHVLFDNSEYGKDSSIINATISSYYSDLSISNCIFRNNMRSIYGYYGDIHIDSCIFHSSFGEKINLQYSNGIVENSKFYYTYGDNDAIDYDGIENGIVKDNELYGGEDDGIDIGRVSQTSCRSVKLTGNKIHNFLDKGISIGEGSKDIYIGYNIVTSCRNGIAIKDSSTANIDHNTLFKNTFGVSCYEKNYKQGGGFALMSNSIVSNSIISSVLTDAFSQLEIQYCLSDIELLEGHCNLMTKPMFLSLRNYNFNLHKNSPCINSGDPLFKLDNDGTVTDIGALPSYSNSIPKLLLIFIILLISIIGYFLFIYLRNKWVI